MKTSELRFGNWLQTKKHKAKFVVKSYIGESSFGGGNHNNDYDDFDPDINDVEPILLTEEWLVKFGFEEKPGYSHPKYWKGDYFCNLDGVFYTNNESYEGETLSTNIKYVHQLQNLYFALTGQELELK